MASIENKVTSHAVGLGIDGHSKHDPSSNLYESITSERTKAEESMGIDVQDHSENNDCVKFEKNMETETETKFRSNVNDNIPASDEAMQIGCDGTGDEFDVGNVKIEDKVDGDINNSNPTTVNDDDKLLSEISELVDQKHSTANDCANVDDEAKNEIGSHHKLSIDNVVKEERMEVDMDFKMGEETGKINNVTSDAHDGSLGLNETESDVHDDKSYESNPDTSGQSQVTMNEMKKTKESAVQRLASLGLIPEEKPIVEDKDTILKKLASRGGISILPAGTALSSVSSPVTIKPTAAKTASIQQTPAKPGSLQPVSDKSVVKPELAITTPVTPTTEMPTPTKYKPGPKSAKKKIKIDPGKSLDIDKDFNSLISFLSAGSDVSSPSVTSSTSEEKTVSEETAKPTEKLNDSKSETQLDINEASNQSTNDGHGSGMDIDGNDDKSFLESESESHDGSKFEHSSENDEKSPMINKNKNVIEEGSAEILLSSNKNVFYNKVQEFNRDMSIAALTVFSEMHQQDPRTRNRGKKRKATDPNEIDSSHADSDKENVFEAGKKSENGITILEALSATGLRSIRYAREIPGVKEVIANDLSEDAVDTIKQNVEHNGVGDIVTTSMSDASLLMYQRQASQEWYDAVDLDPYGCPSRFLDAAVQAVRDGGLLLVTCTDMAILAGNSPETCYVKYGAVSLRMPACHEMALRIALQCIESHANRYGRYIVPLLSFSADFYIRLIVQVYTSPVTCKRTTSKLAMVYQCVGCGTHSLHPLGNTSQVGHNSQPKFSLAHGPPVGTNCFHCHHKHNIGGPIWTAPLYSPKFLESMLKVAENGRFGTAKRMQGMLEVIREELMDVPLYYTIAGLCTKLHCQAIPLIDIRSAILNAGYRVSSSHTAPTAVKTNAPSKVIWDIMRCWVHMNPVSQKRLVTGSVSAAIILEPPNLIANFDIHPRARPSSATRKLLRYQQNPEKNWGPGTRARCNNAEDTKDEKRRLNQNKNKNKKHIEIIEVVTIDDEDETTEELKVMETAITSTPTEKE